ncbi:MAG: hypothetical protein WC781_02730 [Candidatus Pacearchaeota archaeon]|jgi:hypothetical protein
MGTYTSCTFYRQQNSSCRKIPCRKRKKHKNLSNLIFINPMESRERNRIISPEIQEARMNLLNIINKAKTKVTQELSDTIYNYIQKHGSDYWLNKARSDYVDKVIVGNYKSDVSR